MKAGKKSKASWDGMKVADVAAALEKLAPPELAEDWDNVGLLVGDAEGPCRRAMFCVDMTEAVVDEALKAKVDLVMAYHPAIFKPLGRVTRQAAPVAYRAAREGLAVYSVHTAYDAAVGGANDALADALGMSDDRRPLSASKSPGACKIVVYVPQDDVRAVAEAAFAAGAGWIGRYGECGWTSPPGTGTFRGEAGTNPTIGRPGRREQVSECRWETVCSRQRLAGVLAALREAHPYEEPAIDVICLDYPAAESWAGRAGLGRVGLLKRPVGLKEFLGQVSQACGVERVQVAGPGERRRVGTLAVGCGSCGSLFRQALAAGAEVYVTGELRHHDALAAAEGGMTVVCVGHSNSERLTLRTLADNLRRLLPGLSLKHSRVDRDPFSIV